MQTHTIQPNNPRPSKKRIGRGGIRGKTSGRGHKGQKQHGGHGIRPHIRDIIKKLPKKRGYKFNSFRPDALVVNVADLNTAFSAGDTVNPETLAEKKLISVKKSKNHPVKILGHGELTKKLAITGCHVSKTAEEKITAQGGVIEKA